MSDKRPFVVLALPRSRTAWLSHWLAYGPRWVGHDIGAECHTIHDFVIPFEHGMVGTVETGAMIAWREIKDLLDPHFVVVKRPIWQVLHSLSRFGFRPEGLVEEMLRRDAMLDEVSALPGVLTVEFDSLGDSAIAKRIWHKCLGPEPFDPQWFKLENGLNIQVDMGARIQRLSRNGDVLATLKAQLASEKSPECLGNC